MALAWAGCSESSVEGTPSDPNEPVSVDLSLSVNSRPIGLTTRMADDIVQTIDGTGRALGDVRIIPFIISGSKVGMNDAPKRNIIVGSNYNAEMSTTPRYYYFTDCLFMQDVNAFMVYAKARRDDSKGDVGNGALTMTGGSASYHPQEIQFRLKQMHPSSIPSDEAWALANYMSRIAQAETDGITWGEINDAFLNALFKNFINQSQTGTADPEPLAGSVSSARAHIANLKNSLEQATILKEGTGAGNMKKRILEIIAEGIPESAANYPACHDLPDGAAVFLWQKTADMSQYGFVPQTQSTTMATINSITRFAYPAELYYYANSRIKTSNNVDAGKHDVSTTWTAVLSENYNAEDGKVSSAVKAVAIKDPLQYAVARLDVNLDAVSTGKLKDADDQDVDITGGKFPVTGIIVGCQRPVDYEFKPLTRDDGTVIDTEMRFIYDSQVNDTDGKPKLILDTTASGKTVSTLVLQNMPDEYKTDDDDGGVPIILEIANNSDQVFKGIGGVIRPGTKFYLVGKIKNPTYDGTNDYSSRVFTKDYTTTVTLRIASLAKAYNVLPDLLSARLEMGAQLKTSWTQSSSSYVIMTKDKTGD